MLDTNCRQGGYTLLLAGAVWRTGDFQPLAKDMWELKQRGRTDVLLRRSQPNDITACVANERAATTESEREWRYKRHLNGAQSVILSLGTYHYTATTDTGNTFTVYGEDYEYFVRLAAKLNVNVC